MRKAAWVGVALLIVAAMLALVCVSAVAVAYVLITLALS